MSAYLQHPGYRHFRPDIPYADRWREQRNRNHQPELQLQHHDFEREPGSAGTIQHIQGTFLVKPLYKYIYSHSATNHTKKCTFVAEFFIYQCHERIYHCRQSRYHQSRHDVPIGQTERHLPAAGSRQQGRTDTATTPASHRRCHSGLYPF